MNHVSPDLGIPSDSIRSQPALAAAGADGVASAAGGFVAGDGGSCFAAVAGCGVGGGGSEGPDCSIFELLECFLQLTAA
jgi:hypothetical protein